MKWEKVKLGEVLIYEQPTRYIVESEDYDDMYPTPVLTAGKTFILGYTDETNGIYTNLPAIIFDDFTTESKFVTFPFKVKSSAMKILTCDTHVADIRYMFYLLKNLKVLTDQHKRYWISKFANLEVHLPPLHIQEQIADTLDKADALRRKDQELLQKYDQLAQAIFYDMFGDPVRNERGWECRELSDLAEIIMGQSPPGETYNSEGLGDPLLNGPTEFGELHPVEKQWTTSPTKYCKRNDILFCVRGATAGKLNVADKVYCIGRGLAAIRPKVDSLSSYLYLYLNNMYDVFQKTSDGSTFINISGDRLKSLSIPLLPESDLAKFQKMSERLQEGIRVAKKSTDMSKMLFKGVMTNYFS